MPFLTTVIHVGVHLCRSSVLNRILLIFKRMLYPVIHMSLLSWKKKWASSHNPTLPLLDISTHTACRYKIYNKRAYLPTKKFTKNFCRYANLVLAYNNNKIQSKKEPELPEKKPTELEFLGNTWIHIIIRIEKFYESIFKGFRRLDGSWKHIQEFQRAGWPRPFLVYINLL